MAKYMKKNLNVNSIFFFKSNKGLLIYLFHYIRSKYMRLLKSGILKWQTDTGIDIPEYSKAKPRSLCNSDKHNQIIAVLI